jgi:hypothetical protein
MCFFQIKTRNTGENYRQTTTLQVPLSMIKMKKKTKKIPFQNTFSKKVCQNKKTKIKITNPKKNDTLNRKKIDFFLRT